MNKEEFLARASRPAAAVKAQREGLIPEPPKGV
jgi:hypothetical protein